MLRRQIEGAQAQDALIPIALRDSQLRKRIGDMSELYWLNDTLEAKLEPFFDVPRQALCRWQAE